MTVQQGPGKALPPQPSNEPGSDTMVTREAAYVEAVRFGYDAGYQRGFTDGLAAADAHLDRLHRAAARIAEQVARDLRRRRSAA